MKKHAMEGTELRDGESELQNVDYEKLLISEVGEWGVFQWRVLGVASLVAVVSAVSVGGYLFNTARIPTRCVIPECERGNSSEFTPPWIMHAVPGTSTATMDNCHRFNITNTIPHNDTCPATLFDRNITVPCEQYMYGNTDTIVYDLGLACQEWRRALMGTAHTLGSLAALIVAGSVSDRWGRRTALLVCTSSTALFGLAHYFVTSYFGFLVTEFLEAALGSGEFSCIFILLMELVGPRHRMTAGAVINTFFSMGHMLLALVAWRVRYWRHRILILYGPQLLTICYYWLVPESIIWYMSKGRYNDAQPTLEKLVRINGRQISEQAIQALSLTAKQENNKSVDEKWLPVLVFRNKAIFLRCLVVPVWWITFTLVYYGMSVNAASIWGNQFANYAVVSAAEIPGYWLAVLLMDRFGRKPILTASFFACAACQIIYVFKTKALFGVSLAAYLVGKLMISLVGTVMYVYTSELFPTRYRHRLFAYCSMVGRVGSITAPLTPALSMILWEPLPFVLFGGMAAVSGLLVLVMPETRGCRLPNTMQDAADIGREPTSY